MTRHETIALPRDPAEAPVRPARRRRRLAAAVLTVSLGAASITVLAEAAPATAASQSGTPAPGVTLAPGATGAVVKAVQLAMMANGFTLRGGATGVFDANTLATLKSFQRVVGLKVTGVIDEPTARVLKVSLTPAPAPVVAPAAPAQPFVLPRAGQRGQAVLALQGALVANKIALPGGADGLFGPATTRAVRKFQRSRNLPVTGRVDQATAVALGLVAAPATPPAPVAAPAAPPAAPKLTLAQLPVRGQRGAAVLAVQTALVAAGIPLRGGADGLFGGATWTAIVAFQRSKGLNPTGTLDYRTALELGVVEPPAARIAVFPVQGPCSFADTWMAPRPGGRRHEGVDIIAAEGKEIYAAISGTVTTIWRVGTNKLTGNGLRIVADDGTGTYVFYAHLATFAEGIRVGTKVTAGQVVGTNGKTGTHTPHLHFELHPGGGVAVNPYPAVKAVDACHVTTPRR